MSDTPFITSFTTTALRNNFAGWVGFRFAVGADSITVTSLGRWVVSGNTGSHAARIVRVSDGVIMASATINTSGATAGAFAYVALGSSVTLAANTQYYLVTEEVSGGDQWYDDAGLAPVETAVATIETSMWSSDGTTFASNSANDSYVPPNFRYAAADATPPTFTSWVAVGDTITGTVSEALDPAFVPYPDMFIPRVNGAHRPVINVAVSGSGGPGGVGQVTLTLESPVSAVETVTLDYNR